MARSDFQASKIGRRRFLQSSASTAALAATWASPHRGWAQGFRSANEQPVFGYIGTGIRYRSLVANGIRFGPAAAVCDVDSAQMVAAVKKIDQLYREKGVSATMPAMVEDYRRILDRSDIDAVVIATPDHWHVKIAIEALLAGKDVYCEKPLTHHVAEGQQIIAALERSKGVMQVGSQQRSSRDFQTAVAMTRAQRAGKVKHVTCGIQTAPTSDHLPAVAPPSQMNWNRWLGQAPWVEYREAPKLPDGGYGNQFPYGRTHAHFRWWYEYAGGKLTDWGAHHVDIAMWALNKSDGSIGKYTVDPLKVDHPVEFDKDGMPTKDDRFNTASNFHVRTTFADGIKLDIVDNSDRLNFDNGIMFECEKGRYFVNRGKLTGKAAEELADDPLPESAYDGLYQGPSEAAVEADYSAEGISHMENFANCVKSRETPISDAASNHRHLTVCHVGNIAMRLGRKVTFDPATEKFVDDEQADNLLYREPRKGFETEM